MRAYVITCAYGGKEWDVLSIWSTREKAEAEKQRLWDTDDNGVQMYGYDLTIEEWELDVPEQNTDTRNDG